MARVMADMGLLVKDGNLEQAPPPAPPAKETGVPDFTTMGEHARFRSERPTKPADPATPPPAEPPKPGDPPPPAPPAAKKVEVEKGKPIEEIVEGVVKRLQKPEPPAPTTAPPPPAKPGTPDPDAAYIESLEEVQREELELAQFAAERMPDKYANLPKRTIEYLKKVDEFIAGKTKEDPNWDPDEDESFSAFVQENRPSFQPGDRKKLERGMIAAEVRTDLEKEFQPKLQEAERSVRAQEIKPEIDNATQSYRQYVANALAPDDKSPFHGVIAKVVEKGLTEEAWKEAKVVDPLAVNIARPHLERAVSLGREYLELAAGVREQVPFRSDLPANHKQNQLALRQAQLFGFIDQQETHFAEHGGNLRIAEGKSFLPRREFFALPKAEQAKHWTLGHQDVLDILARDAAFSAQGELEAELKRREEEGYVRNGKKEIPKPETPPPVTPPPSVSGSESPRATSTPSPGAGTPPPPPAPPVGMSKTDLDKMLNPGVRRWD